MSAWSELPITDDKLPLTVRLKGVRVRAWQGIPDITVDNADQVEFLDAPPWGSELDLTQHTVEVELHELSTGASRVERIYGSCGGQCSRRFGIHYAMH